MVTVESHKNGKNKISRKEMVFNIAQFMYFQHSGTWENKKADADIL